MSKYNMSGDEVTLDLDAIELVLGVATAELSNSLQQQLARINDFLRDAHTAKFRGQGHEYYHEHYLGLCHANTSRDGLVLTAQQLADAIQAQFHVAEACKRNSVVMKRTKDDPATDA